MPRSYFYRNNSSLIYTKALEIRQLAKTISHYILLDVADLQSDGKEDPHVYLTGDIIQQSHSLIPQILKAENQPFQDQKEKYAAAVLSLSNRLYKTCKQLQKTNSNGKDFLPLILKELRKFRQMQNTWLLTL